MNNLKDKRVVRIQPMLCALGDSIFFENTFLLLKEALKDNNYSTFGY